MDNVKISISGIKSIVKSDFELPLESGIYCFVGNNGCGKSTLLLAMGQLTSKFRLRSLRGEDFTGDSYVEFGLDGKTERWSFGKSGWDVSPRPHTIKFNGMYEGSLFYGTRFSDSRIVDSLLESNKLLEGDIVDSDDYIKEKMSYILHGHYNNYKGLKRIKNREICKRFDLGNTPYFNAFNGKLVSQYRMSSGECLLISLLHFVYNAIIRRSLPTSSKILVLIDEIELALHPIAVSRFLDLLKDLQKDHGNLVVYLTSHSPEVIRKIDPKNIFMLKNSAEELSLINPCFPSYAIRDVYRHDGFDHLLLVEDVLAAHVINKVMLKKRLKDSKLIHVVPVGGWRNVLQLHRDLLQNNVLGLGRDITSILDGDIVADIGVEFSSLKKLFLPIKSIEKFLYEVILEKPNNDIIKILNDKYFTITSLDSLIAEHNSKYRTKPEQPDKKFYFRLKKDLEGRNITEASFVQSLCDDIMNVIDFSKFEASLEKLVSKSNPI